MTPPLWLAALLVSFAGFCSLVYQVVWERTVKYNFGGDSVSSALVTATFLLGLGIGAAVFGRWRPRAFALFALVEVLLGIWAILSFRVLAPLATVLGRLFDVSIADAEGLRLPIVVACVLFLLPPCILMGGTLPLMFNCFIQPDVYRSRAIGLLYGLNTLGAALGTLAVPFVFLNRTSIPSTLRVVGVGNVVLGAAIWLVGRRAAPPPDRGPLVASPADTGEGWLPLALALGFVSGFVSLAFEVSLFRAFSVFNPSSPYNFPGVLLPFLLGLAVGGIVLTRFRHYTTARALRRIGYLFFLAVGGMLLGIVVRVLLWRAGFEEAFRQNPFQHEPSHLYGLAVYGLVLVVPFAFCLSGVFPLLLRVAAPTARRLPATSGLIGLVNALGSFAGAMLVQFVGFPRLGTRGVIGGLFVLGAAAGGLCLVTVASRRREAILWGALTPLLAVVPWLIPPVVWDVYAFGRTGPNVDAVEGETGVASIEWGRFRGRVFVNGQSMSALPDHRTHVQLVSFALALPRREHVLVLGLGGGGMVRELVRDPGVARVDVVDWSYELPRLLDTPRAKEMLADSLRDPKVRLCRCDARVAVSLYPARTFDVVIDNLTTTHWVGATSVKSLAYFGRLRQILKPSGVLVFEGNYGNGRDAVLAGLVRSFPVVQEHGSKVVLGAERLVEFDRARAQAVLESRAQEIGLAPPYADWLLTEWRVVTGDQLGAGPIRDDRPIQEYHLDPLRGLLGRRR